MMELNLEIKSNVKVSDLEQLFQNPKMRIDVGDGVTLGYHKWTWEMVRKVIMSFDFKGFFYKNIALYDENNNGEPIQIVGHSKKVITDKKHTQSLANYLNGELFKHNFYKSIHTKDLEL